MHNKPIALVILDGFCMPQRVKEKSGVPVDMPNFAAWVEHMPHTVLHASGAAVGLPAGHEGNSELSHVTIGAGRIIPQAGTFVDDAIKNGSLFHNTTLKQKLIACAQHKKAVHIIGILSQAGIGGNQDHIHAYVRAAHACGVKKIYIHAILDDKDIAPHTAYERIEQLIQENNRYGAQLASIHERFYTMDRNKNYDRTRVTYRVLTRSDVPVTTHIKEYVSGLPASGEHCEPVRVCEGGVILSGDYVIVTACRADETRQLVRALRGDKKVIGSEPSVDDVTVISPVSYGAQVSTDFLFEHRPIVHTLKEVLCLNERTVFSIAESEKYAHITYFFNGEKDDVLPCEVRHLIPSRKTSTVDITDTVIRSLEKDPKDFYLINYAQVDMLDRELGRLYNTLVKEMGGTLFIVDLGGVEKRPDAVPFIVVTPSPLASLQIDRMHGLADVAPLILRYMGITVPSEMTGDISSKR